MPPKLFVINIVPIVIGAQIVAALGQLWTSPAALADARVAVSGRRARSTGTAPSVRPALPAAPKIAKFSNVVTKFGAVPNDGKDDTAAIQAAIDATAARGGGSVMFPPGVYNISIQRQGKHLQALKLKSGIRLAASTTQGATIRLADRQGNYESLMGTEEMGTPLTDFAIERLTFDSNGTNNPVMEPEGTGGKISPDFGTEQNLLPRTVFRAYIGKRIRIDRARFTNQLGVWAVVVNGSLDRMTDAAIVNSRFDNVGGGDVDFDHSSIYTQGSRMLVRDNIFSSRSGAGTKGARTAIEIHGSDQTVIGNKILGFSNGINITGAGTPVSARQLYRNNLIDGANTGFTLWHLVHPGNSADRPAMQNIAIERNTVNINADDWLKPGIVSNKGPSAGILQDPNSNAPIQDLRIVKNTFNFVKASPIDYNHDRFSSGIALWKYKNQHVPIERLTISGNRIVNAPGAGIWTNAALGGSLSKIENNTIVNPARSPHLAGSDAGTASTGIYLQGNSRHRNLRIQNNQIVDSGTPARLRYGVVANSDCASGCSIQKNTVKAPKSTPVRANTSWGGREPVSQSHSLLQDAGKVGIVALGSTALIWGIPKLWKRRK